MKNFKINNGAIHFENGQVREAPTSAPYYYFADVLSQMVDQMEKDFQLRTFKTEAAGTVEYF